MSVNSADRTEVQKPKYVIDRFVPVYERKGYDPKKSIGTKQADVWGSIFAWPYASQVWPLEFGFAIAGGVAAFTGFYITRTVRAHFFISGFKAVSYFSTVFIPGILTAGIHYTFVSDDIVMEKTKCPVCVQTRAGFIQLTSGWLYPLTMTATWLLPYMNIQKETFRLPSFIKNPKAVGKYLYTSLKPLQRPFGYLGAAQLVVAMGITYLQQESYYSTVAPYMNKQSEELNEPNVFS